MEHSKQCQEEQKAKDDQKKARKNVDTDTKKTKAKVVPEAKPVMIQMMYWNVRCLGDN